MFKVTQLPVTMTENPQINEMGCLLTGASITNRKTQYFNNERTSRVL